VLDCGTLTVSTVLCGSLHQAADTTPVVVGVRINTGFVQVKNFGLWCAWDSVVQKNSNAWLEIKKSFRSFDR
jgi:hypothetical protein